MNGIHELSSIEKATLDVIQDVNSAITHEWRAHGLHLPEKEFRRIIAGYFERQSMREWCEVLGIDPPDDQRATSI